MKKKNVVLIVSSVIVVLLALALLYRYIVPPSKGTGIMVVVPHPVSPTFNQEQLNTLKNDTVDYSQNITPQTSQLNTDTQVNANQNITNIEPKGN